MWVNMIICLYNKNALIFELFAQAPITSIFFKVYDSIFKFFLKYLWYAVGIFLHCLISFIFYFEKNMLAHLFIKFVIRDSSIFYKKRNVFPYRFKFWAIIFKEFF